MQEIDRICWEEKLMVNGSAPINHMVIVCIQFLLQWPGFWFDSSFFFSLLFSRLPIHCHPSTCYQSKLITPCSSISLHHFFHCCSPFRCCSPFHRNLIYKSYLLRQLEPYRLLTPLVRSSPHWQFFSMGGATNPLPRIFFLYICFSDSLHSPTLHACLSTSWQGLTNRSVPGCMAMAKYK